MAVMLMEVVLLWNLQKGVHVVPENIWVEVHLLDLDAALIVELMAIGPGIAKLETGRTSVTAVETEVILNETARIVQRS